MTVEQKSVSVGADSTLLPSSSDEQSFLLNAETLPLATAASAELATSSGTPLRSESSNVAPETPELAAEPVTAEPAIPVEREESHASTSGALVVTQPPSETNKRRLLAPALAGAVVGGALLLFGRRYLRERKHVSEVEETITINRPARELYDFWRDFTNLPQIMDNIRSVEELGFRRSHWVIKAPAGTTVEFDSRVVDDIPGKLIAWASEEGAAVPNRGRVVFSAEGPGSTRVRVTMSYNPPAGAAGKIIAKLFQREPATQARQDLARFKQIMESDQTG